MDSLPRGLERLEIRGCLMVTIDLRSFKKLISASVITNCARINKVILPKTIEEFAFTPINEVNLSDCADLRKLYVYCKYTPIPDFPKLEELYIAAHGDYGNANLQRISKLQIGITRLHVKGYGFNEIIKELRVKRDKCTGMLIGVGYQLNARSNKKLKRASEEIEIISNVCNHYFFLYFCLQ